jgi:hypothetical protein
VTTSSPCDDLLHVRAGDDLRRFGYRLHERVCVVELLERPLEVEIVGEQRACRLNVSAAEIHARLRRRRV